MTENLLKRENGAYISYEYILGKKELTLVYLHGFQSSKKSEKTNTIKKVALEQKVNYLSLDYTGHGDSSGQAIDFRIGQCLEDALFVIQKIVKTPMILIGSSLGGWIAFLIAEKLKSSIKGVIGMAPAVDFMADMWTHLLTDEIRSDLKAGKIIGPNEQTANAPWSYDMFKEAEKHLLLKKSISYDGNVVLIHGDSDKTIPYQKSFQIKDALTSREVIIHILKGYGHILTDEKCMQLLSIELKRLIQEKNNDIVNAKNV